MRCEILLVTTPPWGVHNPPVGLAYLATYLRSRGIMSAVFDFNIGLYRRIDPAWHKLWLPEYKNSWSNPQTFQELMRTFDLDIEWAVETICSHDAPVVGFSVVDPKERMTIEIIRRMRDHGSEKRIILGGPAVSTPEQRQIFIEYLGSSVDYFVLGEGEEVLYDLIAKYRMNNFILPLSDELQKPLITHKPIGDISTVPHPTYDEFDFTMYDGGGLIVEWSRGCISSCAYCKGKGLLGSFRMKPAEYIVAELEHHYMHYGVDRFIVCDNLLNGNPAELMRACELLIAKHLPVKWEGQAIPYKKMTVELLTKMKQAGCYKIQWGLESASDMLLQNIGKGKIFQVQDVERVIRDCHNAGIRTELFLIAGLPGDTDAESKKTEDFIRKNRDLIDLIKSVNTLHLVHGTELFDHADAYGLCLPDTDWHYLWYEKNGQNSYPDRVRRARGIIQAATECGINVQEHNLLEGEDIVL